MRFGRFPLYHGGGFFWFHLLGAGLTALFWLGLLALLTWAVLRLVRGRPGMLGRTHWQGYAPPPYAGQTATEILRERYARGEIDLDIYQQMLERLQATAPQAPEPNDPAGGTMV
jgi:putative membrane protein